MDTVASKPMRALRYIQEKGPVQQSEISRSLGMSLMRARKPVDYEKISGRGHFMLDKTYIIYKISLF